MQKLYLTFAVLGAVVPYAFFAPFLAQHGLDLRLLAEFLFANSVSTFFAADLAIACAFFAVLMFREAARLNMQKFAWICLLVLGTVGLSAAFPLFMYFREPFKRR